VRRVKRATKTPQSRSWKIHKKETKQKKKKEMKKRTQAGREAGGTNVERADHEWVLADGGGERNRFLFACVMNEAR